MIHSVERRYKLEGIFFISKKQNTIRTTNVNEGLYQSSLKPIQYFRYNIYRLERPTDYWTQSSPLRSSLRFVKRMHNSSSRKLSASFHVFVNLNSTTNVNTKSR